MAKKTLIFLLTLIFTFTLFAQQKPRRVIDGLTYPKLNEIAVPQVLEETLPNGIVLMMVEDHEFPVVNIRAMIKGGKVVEPLEKNGLTELFGDVLRSGGTKNMKSDDIDKYLDRIGASIESYSRESSIEIYGDCLNENTDEVLKLFSDFILNPAFEDEKIELSKTQMRSMISRRNDEPMSTVIRELNKILYGKDSPYARQIEYFDVDNLKKDDLLNYHKTYFRPDLTYIAVWGDFSSPEMKQKIEKYFGNWTIKEAKPQIILPAIPEQKYSLNQIEKNDVEQTFIFMGQLGLRYDDPDYAPTYILTEILGGGFSSRLFKKIRTEMGLAYGAGSFMSPEYDHKGMFYFYTSTKPSTTSKVLSLMLEEIKKVREAPVTDEELKNAKDGYLNRFAFQFDSTSKLVNRMLNYKFYGYPLDFNKRNRDSIEKVTKEDVLRVAQTYLIPDKLTIVALGKVKEFDEPLSKYGSVNTIDIKIPTGKKVELPSNPQLEAKAVELIKKAVKAIGEPAFNSVKDYYAEGKMIQEGMEIPYKYYFIYPDRAATEMMFGEMSVKLVIDGETATVFQGGQKAPIPSSEAEEIKKGMWTEGGGLLILRSVLEGKVKAQYVQEGTFGGQPAELVAVNTPSSMFLLFLDKKSGMVQAIRYESMGEKGKEDVVEMYKNFKDIGGLKVPQDITLTINGEAKGSTKVWKTKINSNISQDVFTK